jgi:general stress protein 26
MPKKAPAKAAKNNGSVKKLRKLMRDIRTAMLTTVARDGSLHSRPMLTSDVEFDGNLWFIACSTSGLAQEVAANPNVNVSYSNPRNDRYISVTGSATLVRDAERLRDLWSGKHKAWFREGKKDPDLTLLRIDVHFAEYWDASADGVQLSQFVRQEAEPAAPVTNLAGNEDNTGAGAQG